MNTPGTALITGGTANLGLAIAHRLAADGWDLILNYAHDGTRARHARQQLERSDVAVRAIRADVTDAAEVARLFREATSAAPVDLLVNNAGAFLAKPFLETSPEEWDRLLAINLLSAVHCCREVLPGMRAHGAGSIVFVSSMHSDRFRATPTTLPYSIAKSGLVAMTKTLAKTEGPYGIRVNAVCPGFIDTDGGQNPSGIEERIPLRRLGRPSEIAAVVGFLASDEASYVTGEILNTHGGALL